jgi:hypothetical protein
VVVSCEEQESANVDPRPALTNGENAMPKGIVKGFSGKPGNGRMKIEGCCHCGRISYEAEINPDYVIICHCTDCQTISGAPYRVTVPVKTENFKLQGQPKTYVKTAASGNKRVLAFCADCGSAIYSTSLEDRVVFSLRLGAVKQRAQLIPKSQGWCRSALPWAMDIGHIPRKSDPAP